jgi:hypothetical protein
MTPIYAHLTSNLCEPAPGAPASICSLPSDCDCLSKTLFLEMSTQTLTKLPGAAAAVLEVL